MPLADFQPLLASHILIKVCSSLLTLKIGQTADGGTPPIYETLHCSFWRGLFVSDFSA